MAFVLVFACLISLFTFKPTIRTDNRVKLADENATSNYNTFYSTTGNETKENYDKSITDADYIIKCYYENNKFYSNITELENGIISSLSNLESENSDVEDSQTIKDNLKTLSQYFDKTDEYYTNLKYFNSFLSAKSLKNGDSYILNQQNKIAEIYNSIEKLNNAKVIVDTFKNNDYLKTLSTVCESYRGYIPYVLNSIIDDIKEQDTLFKSYLIKIAGTTNPAVSAEEELRVLNKLTTKLEEYKALVDEIVTKDNRVALISIKDKEKLDIIVKRVIDITTLNNYEKSNKTKRQEVATKLNNDNYINQLYAFNEILQYVDYSDENVVKELTTVQKYKDANQKVILDKITELKTDTTTSRINEQITSYKLMSSTYNNLVEEINIKNITKALTGSEIKNLYSYDLKTYNEYTENTLITYNTYYLKNNIYSNSYLNNFSYNQTIDYDTSAYDYIFSTLKICTLLTIIFTMMMSAYLISSECDSGTIRLLLMRPFNRGKILSAKMLATLFFSLCFMLLSLVITIIGGLATFGLPAMSKMLVVFNSTFIFEASPIIMLLIYVFTAILDIIFYLIISYFVSIVFKSFAASISTSFITILLSIVLGISLSSTIAYAFIPFTNTSWFRFFGLQNASSSQNILETILATPVQSNMNIWISFVILGLTCAVLYLITYTTFKKRDY